MTILEADLTRPDHQAAVVALTAAYGADPAGNGEPLAGDVLDRLIPGLRALPTTLILLAYQGDEPVGIANCFVGFSTFKGKPLINIHDLAVLREHRGRGIGKALLTAVFAKAEAMGCCRVTLEVNEKNRPAKTLYDKVGFEQAGKGSAIGGALFYIKPIGPS